MLKRITTDTFHAALASREKPWQKNYLAMYSTQWAGYVTDPALMLVPADDHLVHRGDGVFDVMRCLRGKIYEMEAHLSRLERSAKAISLRLPAEYGDVREIIKELVRRGGERDCLIHIVLSRGPGSFTSNPFDCPASQMYINVIRHPRYPEKYYSEGVSIITSRVPIKRPLFATTKSCNYLQNVLMKMEALEAGRPYAVGLDEEGNLAEGSGENIGIVTEEGILKFPGFENTLAGITVQRVYELAVTLVTEKVLKDVRLSKIPLKEAHGASEVFLTGTSIQVLPVVTYDGLTIGTGKPGLVSKKLLALMEKDVRENGDLLTDIAWES